MILLRAKKLIDFQRSKKLLNIIAKKFVQQSDTIGIHIRKNRFQYDDEFKSRDLEDGFEEFVNSWPKYQELLNKLGLDIKDKKPNIKETIFCRLGYCKKRKL